MAETFINLLQSGLSNLGGTISKGYSTVSPYLFGNQQTVDGKTTGMQGFFPWLATPMGEGKNAASPLQLGLAGFGLWQQNQQHQDQLEQAIEAYNRTKAVTNANALMQGANYGNQALYQLQNLKGFYENTDPTAANEYAKTLGTTFGTYNKALEGMGISNGMGDQIKRLNELSNYNINGVNPLRDGA